jgi:hypothetical protein
MWFWLLCLLVLSPVVRECRSTSFNSFAPCSSVIVLKFKSCFVSIYVTEVLLDGNKPNYVFVSYFCSQIVLLLRLVPLLPFNMLNYLLSVTPVGIVEYMLASWLGMMVCSKFFSYLCSFQHHTGTYSLAAWPIETSLSYHLQCWLNCGRTIRLCVICCLLLCYKSRYIILFRIVTWFHSSLISILLSFVNL